jgi:hypothetical protein
MTNSPSDILSKLNRILILTPENAFAVPPVPRSTILAAATEIALLRKRLAALEPPAAQEAKE